MNVTKNGRIPVKSWARDVEGSAQQQADNLSRLPFAIRHIALMPDAHAGYGMPIGGVLFADKAVVPYAVGVDIGCGVGLIETSLHVDDLGAGRLAAILQQIARTVPVGNGPQAQHPSPRGDTYPLAPGGSDILARAVESAEVQLGTLGGGNHFLELQRDADGRVWFMLHSGSRSVGKKVCDYWHGVARRLCERWHVALPDPNLAFLPWETDEAHGYWSDMNQAMAWAEENRLRMADRAIEAICEAGGDASLTIDIHHNYAAFENHWGQNGIVHRKGSVRARAGERVLIPGSMGTASYIAEGLGNPESFQSCQHGAGRARSRAETRRAVTLDAMQAQMAEAGVLLVTPDASKVTDEAAFAYKDIEDVMALSADLVRPLSRHTPIGVVKG